MKKKKTAKDFEKWYKTMHTVKCQANYDVQSGEMEDERAIRMWQRSETKGHRYVTSLSDGDSSSFKAVCNMNDGKGPFRDHPPLHMVCWQSREWTDERSLQRRQSGRKIKLL